MVRVAKLLLKPYESRKAISVMAFVAVVLLPGAAYAQGQGSITGVVKDTSSAVLPREVMDAIPSSHVPYEMAVLVPGVTATNNCGTAAVTDVGGTAGNQAQNGLTSHGSATTDLRVTYNGVTLATMETGKNAGVLS